ncbi:MAG TPA: methionine synthase [Phycisphaerae bacterium]|nr:methionine synthase [Phycisphaerae bacterium]
MLDIIEERVLVLDGAIGTGLHQRDLPLSDYRDLENCGEVLNLTRPDVVRDLHRSFLEVGCDGVTTNTFSGGRQVLAEFGLQDQTVEINRRAAEIARQACDEFSTPDKPRFVIGSIGPGIRLASLGQTDWDQLVEGYTEQARGLLEGGTDALNIETCQDILQVKAAVVAAGRAMERVGREVPIICSVTIETTGTMLLGTEIGAAVVALAPYDRVKIIGMNCATGPQEMSEHVRYLSSACDRYLLVQPNAGLPQLVDGRPHYTLTPRELTRWLVEFIEVDGVNLVGGCCGTTPEHLAAVVRGVGTRRPKQRRIHCEPSVSSIYQPVTIRQDTAILAIGERTNANGSKKFRELLAAGDYDGMIQMGREQVEAGSHLLDVCTAYVGRDEAADVKEVIRRFATDITAPLVIDSTEVNVIEDALKLLGGRSIINSINLEDGEKKLDEICTLARRHGAALIALTIDEEGMAKTADRKVAVARRIHDLVTRRHGMNSADLIFDPLTFTICTGNEDDRRLAAETLEAIRRIKVELPGVHTLLGVSNVSFGLKPPTRTVLNSVFLHYAREAGLDAAILHVGGIVPLFKIEDAKRIAAEDLIFDRRRDGYDPLETLISLFPDGPVAAREPETTPKSVEDRLKHRIIDGNRTGLDEDLDEALTTYRPLDVINDILLDGMKTVGDLFGAGRMQLPFVLKSAETMKAAVAYLEPYMDRYESGGKGSIVLATVRGDVHDIGKNLVDIILTNNGYTVHNLGIKQPISAIIDAYQEHNADAIGMSGLLVKSTVVMGENLAVLKERGLSPPVILGGAALTRKYVEQDLRPEYPGPLFYAKDAFDGLQLLGAIVSKKVAVAPAEAPVAVEATAPPSRPPEIAIRPTAAPARSAIRRDVPIPAPPFWGSRVVERIELQAALGFLNENMLFQVQWQYRKAGRTKQEYERYVNNEVRPIYRDLVERCRREGILAPQAIYGYWPAQAEGDTLIVYDPAPLIDGDAPPGLADVPAEVDWRPVAHFEFPRQGKPPYWCLSDFFRPIETGQMDVAAFMVVTVGRKASDVAREWFADDRYRDYLHLHGLSVESAEALAEYLHKQIRVEWGIADDDARDRQGLFKQQYRGSRYSFGYPACPRLEDQIKFWPLLQPGRIGVELSEEFQLEPEQSTTALICHHPEAKYFSVK